MPKFVLSKIHSWMQGFQCSRGISSAHPNCRHTRTWTVWIHSYPPSFPLAIFPGKIQAVWESKNCHQETPLLSLVFWFNNGPRLYGAWKNSKLCLVVFLPYGQQYYQTQIASKIFPIIFSRIISNDSIVIVSKILHIYIFKTFLYNFLSSQVFWLSSDFGIEVVFL